MTSLKSDFLRIISERGYLHQCTDLDTLDSKLTGQGPQVAYIGFDCTAPSLHVGNLIAVMLLHHWQQTGHKPLVVMGGGTTKVGDPSGKDEGRKLLTEDEIAQNMSGIKTVFSKFLHFGLGQTDAVMIDNATWLNDLNYIDFLRDYGRHFSVNRMLGFDSVKLRLEREHPLSFLEFNYMIFQAYDFLELSRRQDCILQMGGSDQWGNIVNGVDLGRRIDNRELFGLTSPLLTTASGAKMGKTAKGALWLNSDRVAPWDYWQFWRNCDDADVSRFLKLFTLLPLPEIDRLSKLQGSEINEAKKILSTEATKLAHGPEAAQTAAMTALKTFEEGTISGDHPLMIKTFADLKNGIPIYKLLLESKLATSNSDARRLIKGKGARINEQIISEDNMIVTEKDIKEGQIILTAGKKRHVIIKIDE